MAGSSPSLLARRHVAGRRNTEHREEKENGATEQSASTDTEGRGPAGPGRTAPWRGALSLPCRLVQQQAVALFLGLSLFARTRCRATVIQSVRVRTPQSALLTFTTVRPGSGEVGRGRRGTGQDTPVGDGKEQREANRQLELCCLAGWLGRHRLRNAKERPTRAVINHSHSRID